MPMSLPVEIIPAIMPRSFLDLKEKVSIVKGATKVVQVDLCDGVFVKRVTWPFHAEDKESMDQIISETTGMPEWESVDYELDLMVADAVKNIGNYFFLGPKRIIFHIEAFTDPKELSDYFENLELYIKENTEFGIALNIDTDISVLEPFVSHIKFIQCMGIATIGRQGEPFDERVIEKIKSIRAKYPDMVISIDGGVSFDTAPELIEAGATRLVAGSAIFENPNPHGAIQELKSLR